MLFRSELWEYIDFDPGVSPARGNVASSEQKQVYNTIQDLLGEVSRLDATEPFRAAKIAGDLDRYLTDEETALEASKGKMDAGQKQWLRKVKKARKKFMKMKDKEAWGDIARVIGGVATGGLTEAAGAVMGVNPAEVHGWAGHALSEGDVREAMQNVRLADAAMLMAPAAGYSMAHMPFDWSLEGMQRQSVEDVLRKNINDPVGPRTYIPPEEYIQPELPTREEVIEGDMVRWR